MVYDTIIPRRFADSTENILDAAIYDRDNIQYV